MATKKKNWWGKLEGWQKGAIGGAIWAFMVLPLVLLSRILWNSGGSEVACNLANGLLSLISAPYTILFCGLELPPFIAGAIIILAWGLIGAIVGYIYGFSKQ